MIPYFFEMSPTNLEHMEQMLYPFYIGGITLLQQWPAEGSRLKVLARPFDEWVGLASAYFRISVHIITSDYLFTFFK